MPTLMEVGSARMRAPWRAAMVVLCAAFPDDPEVWARVEPAESMDLTPLLRDPARPVRDRVLLAVAQSFVADRAVMVPFDQLAALSDSRLRLVLDALAIARGSLPID